MDKLPEKWCIFPKNNEEFQIILTWARVKANKKYNNWVWHPEVSFDYTGEYRGYIDSEITFEDFKKLVLKENNMKELKITEEKVKETIKNHPESKQILESLFPEVIEKTFKIGNIVELSDTWNEKAIVAQIYPQRVCIIGLSTGNRYHEPMLVGDLYNITLAEMRAMGYKK